MRACITAKIGLPIVLGTGNVRTRLHTNAELTT